MNSKKHEMKNITFNGEGRRFGTWSADCSCRKWVGTGATRENLQKSFKKHVDGK